MMPTSGYVAATAVALAVATLALGWSKVRPRDRVVLAVALIMGSILAYVPWQYQHILSTLPPIHDITTDTDTHEAEGSVFESEIWADLPVVQSLFNRNNIFQTVRARLQNAAALETLKRYIDEDPRLKLDVKSEADYFADQASQTSDLIQKLGWPLAIAMALGALAARSTPCTARWRRAQWRSPRCAPSASVAFPPLSARWWNRSFLRRSAGSSEPLRST